MRVLWLLTVFSLLGTAQTPNPPALIRGVVLERDTQAASGQFSVRAADNQVYRYQFDRKTYVEREDRLIDVPRLQPGEKVEVVSDVVAGSVVRYARTVHVMDDVRPPRPASAGVYRAYKSSSADRTIPSGNLTFSGVVFRLNTERVVLHTRDGGEKTIQLRKDTRYLENGEIVDASNLKPNMRVFVRGAKDLYDQVEAYQVIWGTILDPQ